MKKLYESCENDIGTIRMTSQMMFDFLEDILYILRQGKCVEFGGYDPKDSQVHYLEINEPTLIWAFTEYYQRLIDSPMICSKAKTLKTIHDSILYLEEKDWFH